MSRITIYGTQCHIEEEEHTVLRALDRELSFRVQGAEHMPAYKGWVNKSGQFVRWDGETHLLTRELMFPYGLLERVKDFYNTEGRPIELIDKRSTKSILSAIDILPRLKEMGKEPFYYQLDAVRAAEQYDCGILKLSTGAGKTIISALVAARFGKKTIVYVIGKGLLYQTHSLFSNLFDQKIGIIGDGKCEIADINIATIWTVGQALGIKVSHVEDEDDEESIEPDKYIQIREMLEATKVHIIDECHLSACNTIQDIVRGINPEHIYGMSASPWRDDGADLLIESVLGRNIIDVPATKLIDEGYLVRPHIKFLEVPRSKEKLGKEYQTIYKKYIIDNDVRNKMVAVGAEKLVETGYQTLVLYNSIEHGKTLYNLISQKVPTLLLSGKDSAKIRDAAKENLESGKIKCIVASKIFDLGIDLPSLGGLVVASAGKSSVRALQRVGRVIRKHPGKHRAAVIDFIDQERFLIDHSKKRKQVYEMESGFNVSWLKK